MITVAIKEAAVRRGIKTAYQLQKALKVSPSMAARLFRNDVERISIEMLDRLCLTLECEPNDLLKFKGKGKK